MTNEIFYARTKPKERKRHELCWQSWRNPSGGEGKALGKQQEIDQVRMEQVANCSIFIFNNEANHANGP